MSYATLFKCCFTTCVVLALGFLASLGALINERSKDTCRITLTSDDVYGYDLGPSVSWLQRVTGKEAVAIPLNGNSVTATKWQLRLEEKR